METWIDKSCIPCSAESDWKKKEWQHEYHIHFVESALGKKEKTPSKFLHKKWKSQRLLMHAWSADQLDHHLTQRLLWFLPEQLQESACKSIICIPMTLLSTVRMCWHLWLDLNLQQVVWLAFLVYLYRKSYGDIVFCIVGNWSGWYMCCHCWISIWETTETKQILWYVMLFPLLLSVELQPVFIFHIDFWLFLRGIWSFLCLKKRPWNKISGCSIPKVLNTLFYCEAQSK